MSGIIWCEDEIEPSFSLITEMIKVFFLLVKLATRHQKEKNGKQFLQTNLSEYY